MKKFELARRALGDLEEIWAFIAQDSLDAADRLIEEFYRAFHQLAETPGIGHTRRDLTSREVLFWPVRSYLITYQPSSPLRVVRVIHGRRDVRRLLRKNSH